MRTFTAFKSYMIYYIHGLVAPKDILRDYSKVVNALLNHDTTGIDLKKVKGAELLWRIKVNNKIRIFLTRKTKDHKVTWIFLHISFDHNYNKALRNIEHHLKHFGVQLPDDDDYECVEYIEETGQPSPSGTPISTNAFQPVTIINHSPVFYSDEQHHIITDERFPKMISGPAGSGKTLSTLGVLAQICSNHLNQEKRPSVLYITPSQRLIDETHMQWQTMPNHEALNITFSTYEDWCIERLKEQKQPTTLISTNQFNEILKKLKSPFGDELSTTIRYEFGLLAVLGFDIYLKLGVKQSYFTKEDDKRTIIRLFKEYKNHLSQIKLSDLSLTVAKNTSAYDFICVDEGQQLPLMAFDNLLQQQMIISLDTHQCLLSAPLIFEHIRTLFSNHKIKPNIQSLTGTYRCGANIAALANKFLELGRTLGEKEKIISYTTVQSVRTDVDFVIHLNRYDGVNLPWLQKACEDPDTVIITNVTGSDVQRLKETLNTEQILSVINSIGLTFKHVILYKPLGEAVAKNIEQRLKGQNKSAFSLHERTYINGLMVAVTRATERVTIIQDTPKHYPSLFKIMCEPYTLQADVTIETEPCDMDNETKIKGWHERIKEHVINGRLDQAKAVAIINLKLTKDDADLLIESYMPKAAIKIPQKPDAAITFILKYKSDKALICQLLATLLNQNHSLSLAQMINQKKINANRLNEALNVLWEACNPQEQLLFIDNLMPDTGLSETQSQLLRLKFLSRNDCDDITAIFPLLAAIIDKSKVAHSYTEEICQLILLAINNNNTLLTVWFTLGSNTTTLLNELCGTAIGRRIFTHLSKHNQIITANDFISGYQPLMSPFWKLLKFDLDIIALCELITKFDLSPKVFTDIFLKNPELYSTDCKAFLERSITSLQFLSYLGILTNYHPNTPPQRIVERWLSALIIDDNVKPDNDIDTQDIFDDIIKDIYNTTPLTDERQSPFFVKTIAHMRYAVWQSIKQQAMQPKTAAHLIALQLADFLDLYTNKSPIIDVSLVSVFNNNGLTNWYIAVNTSLLAPTVFNNKEPFGYWIDLQTESVVSQMPFGPEATSSLPEFTRIWPTVAQHGKQRSEVWQRVILPTLRFNTYSNYLTSFELPRYKPSLPLFIGGDWQNSIMTNITLPVSHEHLEWPVWCNMISNKEALDDLLIINPDTKNSFLSSLIRDSKYIKFVWCGLNSDKYFAKWFIDNQIKPCCLDYNGEPIQLTQLLHIENKGYFIRDWLTKINYKPNTGDNTLTKPIHVFDPKLYGPCYPLVMKHYQEIRNTFKSERLANFKLTAKYRQFLTQVSNLELATNKGVCIVNLLLQHGIEVPLFLESAVSAQDYQFLYTQSYHSDDGNTPGWYYLLTNPVYENIRHQMAKLPPEKLALMFHPLLMNPEMLEQPYIADGVTTTTLLHAFTRNASACRLLEIFINLNLDKCSTMIFTKNNLMCSQHINKIPGLINQTPLFFMLSHSKGVSLLYSLISNPEIKQIIKEILLTKNQLQQIKSGLAKFSSSSYQTSQFLDMVTEQNKYILCGQKLKINEIIHFFKRFNVYDGHERPITDKLRSNILEAVDGFIKKCQHLPKDLLLTMEEREQFSSFLSNANDVMTRYFVHNGTINSRYDLAMLLLLSFRQFSEQYKKASIELVHVSPNEFYIVINRHLMAPVNTPEGYENNPFIMIIDVQKIELYTADNLTHCALMDGIHNYVSIDVIERGHCVASRLYELQSMHYASEAINRLITDLKELEFHYVGFVSSDISRMNLTKHTLSTNQVSNLNKGILNEEMLIILFDTMNYQEMDKIILASIDKILLNKSSRTCLFYFADRSITCTTWLINYAFSISSSHQGAFKISETEEGSMLLSKFIRELEFNSYFTHMVKAFVLNAMSFRAFDTSCFYIKFCIEYEGYNKILCIKDLNDLNDILRPVIADKNVLFAKINQEITYFDVLIEKITLDNPIFYLFLIEKGFISAVTDLMITQQPKNGISDLLKSQPFLIILATCYIYDEKKAREIMAIYQKPKFSSDTFLTMRLTSSFNQLIDLLEEPAPSISLEQFKSLLKYYKASNNHENEDIDEWFKYYFNRINNEVLKCKTHGQVIIDQQHLLKNRTFKQLAQSLAKLIMAINGIIDETLRRKDHHAILMAFCIKKHLGLFDRKQFVSVISMGDDGTVKDYYIIIRGFQVMNFNHYLYYQARDCLVIDMANQNIMTGQTFATEKGLFSASGFANRTIKEVCQCWYVLDDMMSLIKTTDQTEELTAFVSAIQKHIESLVKLLTRNLTAIEPKTKASELGIFSNNHEEADKQPGNSFEEKQDVLLLNL